MNRIAVSLLALASFTVAAGHASAAPIVLTDYGSWLGGAPGVVSAEDFSTVPAQALPAGTTTLGLWDVTLDKEDFLNTVGSGELEVRVTTQPLNGLATFMELTPASGESLYAFGAFFTSTLSSGELKMIVNGTTILFSDYAFSGLSSDGSGFLGVIDTVPFTTIRFEAVLGPAQPNTELFSMQNVSMVAVPEPGPSLLLAVAFGAMAGARHRRSG